MNAPKVQIPRVELHNTLSSPKNILDTHTHTAAAATPKR